MTRETRRRDATVGPGVRVVLTGARDGFTGLADALAGAGYAVVEQPLLSFTPPEGWSAFDGALAGIDTFRAVAVTSPRAAEALAARLPRKPCRVPVWTSGERSGSALADCFSTIHVVRGCGDGAAESVAAEMLRAGIGGPVLFPCGNIRRETFTQRLEAAGIRVQAEVCYRTVLGSGEAARAALRAGDILVVTSPSVARLLATEHGGAARPRLVAVGPTTAGELVHTGWPPDAVAARTTTPGILDALSQLFSGEREDA
jgi:uroporphyrinogen-III synthase